MLYLHDHTPNHMLLNRTCYFQENRLTDGTRILMDGLVTAPFSLEAVIRPDLCLMPCCLFNCFDLSHCYTEIAIAKGSQVIVVHITSNKNFKGNGEMFGFALRGINPHNALELEKAQLACCYHL